MSNLIGDLNNATKALNAHRFGVTTAGNNIANVNNPDFARQRVVLGDRGTIQTLVGPRGLGVEVVGFQHMRDVVLDSEVLRETSVNSSLESRLAALEKAEANTGQIIDRTGDSPFVDAASGSGSGGLAETLNDFFNAFHALSANPASEAEKEALVQKADILANQINVGAQRFDDLQTQLTDEVETDLAEANRLLEEVARLNAEIARAEASKAGQALELRDQRQAKLESLSKLVQVQVSPIEGSGGQVRVSIQKPSGANVALVELGQAEQLAFDNSLPGLPQFSVKSSEEVVEIRGGSIHGALAARDGGIQKFKTNLDALAADLVEAVNGLYNSGSPPGDTNFFRDAGDPADKTAAGLRLDPTLDASTLRTTNDPAQLAGDNALALALAEIGDEKRPGLGERTFGSFHRASVSDLGQTVSSTRSQLDDEKIVLDLLQSQQDAVSGVSIDEEMTDMMKFQRAFEATSRVIRAIDEMLDTLINRTGG